MQILDALAERSNVKMFFHHDLKRMLLDQNTAEFQNTSVYPLANYYPLGTLKYVCRLIVLNYRDTKEKVAVKADLIVGADGAHSATRKMLQRNVR